MFEGREWTVPVFGAPRDALRLGRRRWDAPKAGEGLVRVKACGAALPDLLGAPGVYPLTPVAPVTPGQEVAGEVVAVPTGSAYKPGDRIMGCTTFTTGAGGYADYSYVTESRSALIPDGMSDVDAAGFPVAFRTAYSVLVERVPVLPGQVVLVLGAAGSSGLAAIKLAKALGATSIAVASSDEKAVFCTRIGADHALNYNAVDLVEEVLRLTGGRGADIIFDPVGGIFCEQAVRAIARFGRLALIGFASGEWPRLDPLDMVIRNYAVVGVFAGGFTEEEDRAAYTVLSDMVAQGRLTSAVTRTFALDDLPDLIQLMQDGAPAGKFVVTT